MSESLRQLLKDTRKRGAHGSPASEIVTQKHSWENSRADRAGLPQSEPAENPASAARHSDDRSKSMIGTAADFSGLRADAAALPFSSSPWEPVSQPTVPHG